MLSAVGALKRTKEGPEGRYSEQGRMGREKDVSTREAAWNRQPPAPYVIA